ncbi:MAG: hypothetical protein ACI9NT_001832 [Bacteroidia bacterium]|jgi:hypothetical protein
MNAGQARSGFNYMQPGGKARANFLNRSGFGEQIVPQLVYFGL